MIRNSKYLYGSRDVSVPLHLHFGEFMLENFWKYKDEIALINGVTNKTTTYGQLAQEATNLAVSLVRLGVRKGEVAAIMCENRPEFHSILVGVVCTGVTVTTIDHLKSEGEVNHLLSISKPKYLFCSSKTYKMNEHVVKSNKMLSKVIIIDDDDSISDVLFYKDLATVRKNCKLTNPEINSRNIITSSFKITESSLSDKESSYIVTEISTSDKESSYIVNESSSSDKDSSSDNKLTKNYKFDEIEVVAVNGQTDTLFILYSSGTTGLPKGIMLTHFNILTFCKCQPFQFTDGTVLITAPCYVNGGLLGTLSGFCTKKTLVFLPEYKLELITEAVKNHKVETLAIIPPFIVAATKATADIDFSSVRRVLTGSSCIRKDVTLKFLRKFLSIQAVLQVYGMTEHPALSSNKYNEMSLQKISSVGRVLHNTVIKVVDIETRHPLDPNQNGEICVKGSMLMKGYVGIDPREALDDEGFFLTGDLGYYDEDGYIYLVDRLKELIKYNSTQVPPAELEALLLQHETVREVGVVGLADEVSGELPLAFIALQPGKTATEAEIQQFVAERISDKKHLRGGVRFIDEIPKNKSGKIDRKLLKTMANNS